MFLDEDYQYLMVGHNLEFGILHYDNYILYLQSPKNVSA